MPIWTSGDRSLTDPIPLSESIYAWILGIAVAASIPFVLLIKQCNIELRNDTKKRIAQLSQQPHDDDFYLSMFHLSRSYHNCNSQIKYACASFLGILVSSALGMAYDRLWIEIDELYFTTILVLSGASLVVLAMPLIWRFIKT